MLNPENEDYFTPSLPSNSSSSQVKFQNRNKVFALFLYVVIFSNFDSGVIPAALKSIEKEMDLNFTQQGLLGCLPYFGISFASIFFSFIIGKLKVKLVLALALFFNIGFCLIFALLRNFLVMCFMRFFMGFTQAFWIIYGPIWTHNFSPAEKQTTWLGFLQGFSPLGLIFGYICTAIIINNWTVEYSWRLSILIQAGLEIPILLTLICFVDNADIDILDYSQKKFGKKSKNNECQENSFENFKILLENKIFLLSSFSVCIAYFVVIGVQFWGTSYMIVTMKAIPFDAMVMYSFITITAPLSGLFSSGYFMDQLGGYRKENRLVVVQNILICSLICVCIAVPLGFVHNLFLFGALLWLEIFFGACNIPPGIGLVVDSVDIHLQSYASSFSQFIYNIFGYFLSPIVSAAIMDIFNDKIVGMKWGFRFTQFTSIVGVFIVIGLLFYVMRDKQQNNKLGNIVKEEKQLKNEEVQTDNSFDKF